MRIGTIGTGNMGRSLGSAWTRAGHDVMFGSREAEKGGAVARAAGGAARSGSYAEAARFGEVVLLATPWQGTEAAVRGAGSLEGKVLLDCTNPLAPDFSSLVVGHTSSAGEEVARWARGARVVKGFNAISSVHIDATPRTGFPEAPSVFYAGDDGDAKGTVRLLITDLGLDPVDAGPLTSARWLEPLAMLWVFLAYALGQGPQTAYRLMRK